jgi:hypothetical protein
VSRVVERRWDTDERGRGIADATPLRPWVDELLDLVTTADWVAEDPEAHLLPHLERQIGADPGVRLARTRVADGVLELDIELGSAASRGAIRELGYRLVSAVAEGVTFVRQHGDGVTSTFEVVTGTPPGAHFATHGHTLRIRVTHRSRVEESSPIPAEIST